jgi:hypothetical protein
VDDEVLAGAPALVGVALARERERCLDEFAVDPITGRVAVLLDDREQIPEQRPLRGREAGSDRVGRDRLRRSLGRYADPRVAVAIRAGPVLG